MRLFKLWLGFLLCLKEYSLLLVLVALGLGVAIDLWIFPGLSFLIFLASISIKSYALNKEYKWKKRLSVARYKGIITEKELFQMELTIQSLVI